jgi:hypothetical protein
MEDLIRQLFEQFPTAARVLSGLLAAHALAVFIVNLTPTPKDDAVLKKVYTVIEWVAGIVSPKVKK